MFQDKKKLKILIIGVVYFTFCVGIVYFYFFRSSSQTKKDNFKLKVERYNDEKKNEDKLSAYNDQEVYSSANGVKDYFKQLQKESDNGKQRYDLNGNLISYAPNDLDSSLIDPFSPSSDVNPNDIYRQLEIKDSLDLLNYYQNSMNKTDEEKQSFRPSSGLSAAPNKTVKTAPTSTTSAVKQLPKPSLGINADYPGYTKKDPYYFHYPLDTSLVYQPKYRYTDDPKVWKTQNTYKAYLSDSVLEKTKDYKDPLFVSKNSKKEKQLEVNKFFEMEEKSYPDNYFVEQSEVDMLNSQVYFFDNETNHLYQDQQEQSIMSRPSRNIKKLCLCEIVGDQFVRNQRQVPIRLKEDCLITKVGRIPQGTVFTAIAEINENRINLRVRGIITQGRLYRFNWQIYDNDGQEGIYVHVYNRYLSIPAGVAKDVYNTVLRSYEAAVVAYIAAIQNGNTNVRPFEIFKFDKLNESGLAEMSVLSLVKEIASSLEKPAVFLKNQYRVYLDATPIQ